MKGEDRIRRYLERAFYGVEKNEKVREEMEALWASFWKSISR